jgi:hypothetical protein
MKNLSKFRKPRFISIVSVAVVSFSSQASVQTISANPADIVSECDIGQYGISKDSKVKRVTGAVLEAEVDAGCLKFATGSDFEYPVIKQKPNGSIVLNGAGGKEVTIPVIVQQRALGIEVQDESGTGKHPQAKVTGLSAGNLVTSNTHGIKFALTGSHGAYDDLNSSQCSIQCNSSKGVQYRNSHFKYFPKEAAFVLSDKDTAQLFSEMPLGPCRLSANFVSANGELTENYEMFVQKALMTIEGRVVGPDGKTTPELSGRMLDVKVPGAYSRTGVNVVIKIGPDGTFKVGPLPTTPNDSYMISLVDLKNPLSVTATAAPNWNQKAPYVLHVELGVRGGVSRSVP